MVGLRAEALKGPGREQRAARAEYKLAKGIDADAATR
jgi:hypothetical protein